jgi:hypothetical protein
MQALRPLSITSAMLVSSSVPEADHAAWSAATVYALGARVIRTQTHRIYERQAAGAGTTPPESDDAVWLDVGPTNRWAMLDESPSTATAAVGSISVTLAPGAAVTGIVLAGVVGASVSVLVNGATVRTAAVPAILAPATCTDLEITGLSIAAGAQIGVTLTGSGTVSIGALLLGTVVLLGETLPGVQVGITDWSATETNAYGVTRIVRRRYSRRVQCSVRIPTSDATRVTDILDDLRARVVWWSADAGYAALQVVGLYRDWSVELRGPTETLYSITIEGLARDDVFAVPEAGNLMAPPAITGQVAAMAAGGVRVSWDQSSDPEWAGSEWRLGASWAAGARLFRGGANDFVWLAPAQGLQTIWGINYDSLGEESAPVSLSLTVDGTVLTVGFSGGNQLFNSDFSSAWTGWASINGGVVANRAMNLPTWTIQSSAPISGDTAAMSQGAPVGNAGLYAEEWGAPIPVTPGNWYCASAFTGAHRCKGAVFVYFFDGSGAVVGNTYGPPATGENNAESAGGQSLENYKRIHGTGQAPATAQTARVALRKYDTAAGQATSYLFACRVMFEQVTGATSAPGPWSQGPSGYVGDLDATKGAPAGTLVGGREAVAAIQSIDAAALTASTAQSAAGAAQTSANSALGRLQAQASDGILSAVEKKAVLVDWTELSGGQAGIVAQANTYAIVTERDAFVAAVTNLNNYLAGLSPGWSDTTQDTTIIPATWRTNWDSAYQRRQQLLNKIADEAGKRATWTTVTGAGKPENNATVGAAFGVNIGGQMTEATAPTYAAANTFTESAGLRLSVQVPFGSISPQISASAPSGCYVVSVGGVTIPDEPSSSNPPGAAAVRLIVNGFIAAQSITFTGKVGSVGQSVFNYSISWHGVGFNAVTVHIDVVRPSGNISSSINTGSTIAIISMKR